MSTALAPLPLRHPELVSGSIVRSVPPYRWQTQSNRQINPLRIFGIDKIDFPRPMPVLQLLLASNGCLHRAEQFEMDQAINRIFGSMAWRRMTAMLRKPLEQVGSYAGVKRAVKLASKDIYARLLFLSHQRSLAAKWTLKQVQGDGEGGRNVC